MRKLTTTLIMLICIMLTGCSLDNYIEPIDTTATAQTLSTSSTEETVATSETTSAPAEPVPSITRLDEFTLGTPNIIEIYDWVDPDTHIHYLIVFDRYKQEITSVTPRYANPSKLIDNDVPSLTVYEDGFKNGKPD